METFPPGIAVLHLLLYWLGMFPLLRTGETCETA